MRREQYGRTRDLFDLGCMPMIEQSVCREILIHRVEVSVGFWHAASARHSRGGVDDDTGGIDETGAHQGRERQRCCSHITTRSCNQLRSGKFVSIQLGQSVHGTREELGLIVGKAVPRWIQR